MTAYQKPPVFAAGALRLHLNENTGGCSPAVIEALARLRPEDAANYPDYLDVTSASEAWFEVGPGWVQLTNGLDEGLQVAAQWAAASTRRVPRANEPNASVIVVEPAFEMYAIVADAAGLDVVRVPPGPDFEFPTEAVLRAITPATRVVYLTDPNNPTGLPISPGAVERVADAVPDGLVLLDEAYAEFSGRTRIGPALDRYRNLVVGRTFAKAHGLAALRIGALVAHPDTLARFRPLLLPFSLNIAALVALKASFADRPFVDDYVAQAVRSRVLIYEFCDRRGLGYWPSEANFVLVRIGDDAPAVVDALAAKGILVRDRSSAPGCAGCVRITAGIVDHTRRCLAALEEILASRHD